MYRWIALLVGLTLPLLDTIPAWAGSGDGAAPPSGKEIVIHLNSETLTAFQDGTPVLQTPVTTGRPALPTPVGITSVFRRATPYLFISPWDRSSPFWYPPSWVTWALEFRSGGYFLHDAPWEPAGSYGAGSEYGPYASHGCVHVPYGAMQFLFAWTPDGTPVDVTW